MRILVVSSDVPFVEGGHRVIARSLTKALRERGYEAEIWYTPQNPFGKQIQAYVANWLTFLTEDGEGRKIDGIISLRYPSFAVSHPNKVVWLNHRMREYYDLWENFKKNLTWKGKVKESCRRWLVKKMDQYFLSRLKKIFVQSRTIQKRLLRWGGLDSEVLYPPPPQRNYRNENYGDYFFFPSRFDRLKRQEIAIRAISRVKGAKLVLAGTGPEWKRLKELADKLGLSSRVLFRGYVSEKELVDLYSGARAVIFVPFQEDYGFVTVEAFYSGKAVITFRDSGGACELVQNGENGFVLEPSEETLAEKISLLWENPHLAEEMGRRGEEVKKKINWDITVEKLVDALK